jgi:hypothetical protein
MELLAEMGCFVLLNCSFVSRFSDLRNTSSKRRRILQPAVVKSSIMSCGMLGWLSKFYLSP